MIPAAKAAEIHPGRHQESPFGAAASVGSCSSRTLLRHALPCFRQADDDDGLARPRARLCYTPGSAFSQVCLRGLRTEGKGQDAVSRLLCRTGLNETLIWLVVRASRPLHYRAFNICISLCDISVCSSLTRLILHYQSTKAHCFGVVHL